VYRLERIRCQPRPATLGFVRRSGDAVSKLDWAGDGAAVVSAPLIPILYALAMASAAAAALVLGHFYDRRGIVVVMTATVIAALASPLVFLGAPRRPSWA
jgi:hypothetical protein